MSAKRLLQNLKGYKLANNDFNPLHIQSLRKLYGNDEGKILGALITGAEPSGSFDTQKEISSKKKRRKRRKRRNIKTDFNKTKRRPVSLSCDQTEVSHDQSNVLCGVQSSVTKIVEYSSDSCDEETTKHAKLDLPTFLKVDSVDTPISNTVPLGTLDSDSDSDTMNYFQTVSSSSSEEHQSLSYNTVVLPTISGEQLSSHLCYKCGRIGHMSNDCLVRQNRNHPISNSSIPQELKIVYAKSRKLKSDKNSSCIVCSIHSNLVNCLDCGSIICDGRGHLVNHLLDHPSHTRLFSYKLGKVVKCCKPNCCVINSYELMICSFCFSKIFSQHYSMITATWSSSGLKAISNSLCCDEHFQWHRMNCPNAGEEFLVSIEKLRVCSGTLSEFLF